MSATTLTARGRWAAEALMLDTCTIEHPTGDSTNPATGVVTTTYATVYTGQCKVNHVGGPSAQEVGEAHLATLSPTVNVPMSVVGVVEGDRVTITTCQLDPELVGKVFHIQGPIHNSYQTARRFQCVEVTS